MKAILWFTIGVIMILIGCFLFISHTNLVLSRILMGAGVLFEVIGVLKWVRLQIQKRT